MTPTYSIATRDTVFTWNVTSSGAVSGVTTVTRDGKDSQPTLAPDGRTVADGSPTATRYTYGRRPDARRPPPPERESVYHSIWLPPDAEHNAGAITNIRGGHLLSHG